MTRYEVAFSRRALASFREITNYIAQDAGRGRAGDWLAKIMRCVATLETHPHAFPVVGNFEEEDIRGRFVMRHVLYYFVDEPAQAVAILDVVHTARKTARERYEDG
ncbi:type II toxin-antitoxin system RelE/ParE family toxin [Candidatus Palauibacter sp.]|uniref:type II toxin-antitoxin system RelE/ParE family toxin n=1 Tax=Candidatus Palauibacter sp. TaxID=3101350 RepID=UPI003C70467F